MFNFKTDEIMFTKNDLEEMFNENKGKVFVIKTNIANGRGINGVDYDKIRSETHVYETGICAYKETSDDTEIKINAITDTMLVLTKTSIHRMYKYKSEEVSSERVEQKKFYLPLDTIQCVEFEHA